MRLQADFTNTLTIHSGILQTGYLAWSLYGESTHQSVEILKKDPPFKIRELGENNFGGFIKLPNLKAGDQFQFKATILFSTQNLKIPILNFKFNTYPQALITQYCRSSKYWETNDSDLIEIAQNLLSESGDDVLKYLHNTFNYVQKNIKFRENQENRLGARLALRDGKGDCDEFSDLFITLCRINNIPARRVLGIILTDEIHHSLHAWSEVYIPLYEDWVPFDVALGEFASIKWFYLIRAHVGLQTEIPLVRFKSKVGKNFRAEFGNEDVSKILILS